MDKDTFTKAGPGLFALRGLSIQQRLPLLICTLLLAVVVSFGFASYYAVRKASMEMGRERLKSLTNELSSMLSQSTNSLVSAVKKTANNDTVRQCLLSGGKELRTEALEALKKLRTDTTVVLVEVMDTSFVSLLSYSEAEEGLQNKLRAFWKEFHSNSVPLKDEVGTMFAIDSSIYFPVITTISGKNRVEGYMISWRLLATSPKAIEQISMLMGKGSVLYIVNTDGNLWTDMRIPISHTAVNTKAISGNYFEYSGSDGRKLVANIQPITSSDWLVVIEFSKKEMLEGADRFLKWIFIIGGLLIVAGIFIAWIMSRNITKPLDQLTRAAMAISKGDYSFPAEVNKGDELGKLASAFNTMKEEIQVTQQNLEQKVKGRTMELEFVNKELESFSYSVSHDLRAPLRAVLGFTKMLEDKYGNNSDEETKRIISVIKTNTVQMGDLIDDLLGFSRMSRQDIVKQNIPTNNLVKDVIAQLDSKDHIVAWNIQLLPDTYGDMNTMRQVWMNLISNAIKYSRNVTSPSIEIGTFNHEDQRVFFVKDNGVGFDVKYKDKLFKVFQRLHSAHEFEGTGVGLAIVEKIVSKHGGRVWAEAEKNKGACFFFSLPDK